MPLATLLGVERLTLSTSNQTPGEQSITVPAGTQGVVVFSRANSAGLTLTSSFAGSWTVIPPSSGVEWLQYAPVTSVGAQTITPEWSSFLAEGPVFYLAYIGNIDNSSPATWVRSTSSGEVDSTNVATTINDLLIALDTCSSSTGTFPGAAAGWTTLGSPYNNGQVGARLRSADAPGASSTTVTRVTDTGTSFHGLSVISIIGLSPSFATGTGPRLSSDFGAGPMAGGPSGEYLRGTSAGGSGTTYNDTLTESVTVAESTATTATFGSTLAEAVTPADANATTATFGSALTETVTPADTNAAGTAIPGAITETVTPADEVTVAATFVGALTETVTPADAQTAVATFTSALAETVTPADTGATVAILLAALAEGVTLADAYAGDVASGSTTYNETIAEALTLADALATSQVFANALSETATFADALSAVQVMLATRSEGITVTDTLAVGLSIQTARTESVTMGDSLANTLTLDATLAEAITLAQALGATQVMLSARSETITLAAVFDASVTIAGGYPDPADVREGVQYGPTGIEFTGTFKGGKGVVLIRRR